MKDFGAQIFLQRLKPLLEKSRIVFDPRNGKTRKFMLENGFNVEDVLEFLKKLSPDHYFDGPQNDRNGTSGDVMIFIYPFQKKRIYIKLKIWKDRNGDNCVLMSFHEEGDYE